MVFYRKYRPQTIGDLDSIKVKDTLSAVLSAKEIPHAFLFTGPKGLGKTSTARIIAKVVNCERKGESVKGKEYKKELHPSPFNLDASIEPCNVCEQCVSITNGTNIDVLEIDGASNRGIDEIRDLREKVRLSPATAKKKVYIIDEVHMLTTEAFNALLKTIEEPPSHVMFIFCTTEPQKVPATIISRCFHVNFQIATEDEIVNSLKRVVKGEKIEIEDDTLYAIARIADGGFRDATKILEEVYLVAKNEKITKDFFEKSYKTANILLHVYGLLTEISKKETKKSLQIISQIIEQSADVKFFTYQVLSVLHNMLLSQLGIKERGNIHPENLQLSFEEIKKLTDIFNKSYQDTKYSVLPQLPLELAVIAYCNESIESEEVKDSKVSSKPTMSSLLRKQESIKIKQILVGDEGKSISAKPTVKVIQNDFSSHPDEKKSLLENVIYNIKSQNQTVAAVLRSCNISAIDDQSVILETAYKFHKERLEDMKSKEMVEKVIKQLTGNNLSVNIILKTK